MFRLLNRLIGPGKPAATRAEPGFGAPAAAAPAAEPERVPESLSAGGPAGGGPVFSSRAVRDATVVTAALESLKRFAEGQEDMDALAFRLKGLTAEQFNFLQISSDMAVVRRAVERAAGEKGADAPALRRILDELSGAAPRSIGVPAARPLPKIPPAPARPGAPRPAAPLPAAETAVATIPAPRSLARDDQATLPVPPPATRPAEGAVPRMPRTDAEARRARLLESLSHHLSTSEAAR